MTSSWAPRPGPTAPCWPRAGTRRPADTPEKRLAYYAEAVPAGRGRRHLLLAARRGDRAAVGRAHAGRLHLQHQGVQPADRAPHQGQRALQGPAAGDRQEERLPRRPARAVVRGGLDAVPVRAGPAGRGRASWARCCSSSRRGSPSGGPTSSTCWRWRSAARRCARSSSSATPPGSTATTPTRRWTSCASTTCRTSAWTCRRATARRCPRSLAATADLAVVRFHGHSDKWTSKDIHEKFGYHYSERELADWAPKLRELADAGRADARPDEQLLPRLRADQREDPRGPPRRRLTSPDPGGAASPAARGGWTRWVRPPGGGRRRRRHGGDGDDGSSGDGSTARCRPARGRYGRQRPARPAGQPGAGTPRPVGAASPRRRPTVGHDGTGVDRWLTR